MREGGQAGDGADDAQVELHVPVTDVTELVRDDALEFVAGQITERPARDAYGSVLRRVTGGESVDGLVAIDDVAQRYRQTRGQGHLLHDVKVSTFSKVLGGRADQPAAEALRDGAAALGEFGDADQAAADDDHQGRAGGGQEKLRLEPIDPPAADQLLLAEHGEDVKRAGEHHDRQHEKHDQLGRASAGLILGPEEIHRAGHGPKSALRTRPSGRPSRPDLRS